MTEKKKVIIVGAGPAGLTAAIYTARANLEPLVAAGEVQATEMPGGQLMITTDVENYPGFPDGIQGPELMDKFMAQAKRFGTTIIEEYATEFELQNGGPFKVKIGESWYESEALILANGASAKWLGLENEDKYRNKGISACATCDGGLPIFRDKELYVVGGGDTAAEEALHLTKFASKVTIIHRRDQLRASKIMQKRLIEHPKIEILWNTVIEGYEGETVLERLKLRNVKTNERYTQEVGGLFMAIGHTPNTKWLLNTGLEFEQGYIKVRDNVYTNIEGVFACGDVHDTHYRQAVTAAGFGCMAAISADRWIEAKNS
jgi:thioredoxin reductase (NADPH)